MRFLLLIGFMACRNTDVKIEETDNILTDNDNDGYDDSVDCDDDDPTIHPNSSESCDGVDNDCDGEIDNGVQDTFYVDGDGDGFGNPDVSMEACEAETGYVANGSDCDDENQESYPGNVETCDNIDNDCNGTIDDGLGETFYVDVDGDGFGNPDVTTEACEAETGYVANGSDCDDENQESYPGNVETCDNIDNDCNGVVDDGVSTTFFLDQDSDGYGNPQQSLEACAPPSGYAENDLDCDDANTSVNPGADETCDLLDNDCNGDIDEDTAIDALIWYADNDADGFGNDLASLYACFQPNGHVQDNTDCDDVDNDIYPGAPELCSTPDDDNCDGNVNEDTAADALIWYLDADTDGFGDPTTTNNSCAQPSGHVGDSTDCNDGDATVNPSAQEVIDNATDDDCDALELCFVDNDNDGFRTTNGSLTVESQDLDCLDPGEAPQSLPSTDCNDTDFDVNPNADEVCDGVDNDCDTLIDDPSAIDTLTWHVDSDNDGFGGTTSTLACDQPSGFVSNDTDCVDTDGAINPNADEVCDGIDNDCDTFVDDSSAVDALTWYADSDNDGFGGSNVTLACSQPSGHVSNGDDCQDNNPSVNPTAIEYCDGIDNDCDTYTDGPSAVDAATWYFDNDADGYGVETNTTLACTQPTNHAAQAGDCDDGNPSLINCVSCDAILTTDPGAQTGIYDLDPCNTGTTKEFWCDMDRDGGGWTLAGWQAASAVSNMGVNDAGTVGGSDWSSDLVCVGFSEIMVFNDTLNQHFIQSYPQQIWNETSTNFTIGTNGNAFKHGSYGPGQIMMGCVNYQYGAGNVTAYACDSDGQASAQGHLADYAGEYCNGGRLDYTWAWSDASTCVLRGQPYIWGYAIR